MGRSRGGLYNFLVPFPDKPSLDPTEAMKEQNYTVRKMVETGNDFYVKMGLKSVPERLDFNPATKLNIQFNKKLCYALLFMLGSSAGSK